MRDHPDIFVTEPKETAFFSENFDRGLDWYLNHFSHTANHRQAGEFTSHYLYDPSVPERIAASFGPLKVLAVVRDPVERSLSQVKYGIRHGHLRDTGRRVLSLPDLRTAAQRYPAIVDRSLYAEGISRFISAMGRSQVLILDQTDCANNPVAVLRKVWNFLEVDESFQPARANSKISVGIMPKSQMLETLRTRLFYFVNARRPGLISLSRKARLGDIYRRLNSGGEIRLGEDAVAYLREKFEEDWRRTQAYCWRPALTNTSPAGPAPGIE